MKKIYVVADYIKDGSYEDGDEYVFASRREALGFAERVWNEYFTDADKSRRIYFAVLLCKNDPSHCSHLEDVVKVIKTYK